MNINVTKASGEKEPFSEDKVKNSLKRAGASDNLVENVLAGLKSQLYEGISTKEVYRKVFDLLEKYESPVSSKYNLKKAIMDLGPSGYPFEKFVAGILKKYGYQTQTNQVIKGRAIDHEIDVLALKEDKNFLIECKFHNRRGLKTNIKVALYVYARFLDVSEANPEINSVWLITNTKVTSRVKKYAAYYKIKITSWNYPEESSLSRLIEKSNLHPITCLNSLSNSQKKILLENNIVFCDELIKTKIDRLQGINLEEAKKEALAIKPGNPQKGPQAITAEIKEKKE